MTAPHQYGPQQPPTSTGSPPGKAKKPKSVGRLLVVAFVAFAVLLGLVSAGLSWQASNKASDALDQIAKLREAQPAVQPAAAPTEESTPDPGPTDAAPTATDPEPAPSGSDPVLTKETQFTVKYTDETLRLPADCNEGINVDVDEPRVRVEGSADFRFADPCGSPTPYIVLLQGVRGSLMDTDKAKPAECVDMIRRSPLSTDEQPIREGQVYCINTSRATADATADTWKMVIMTITAISSDGVVTIKASAWNIPD